MLSPLKDLKKQLKDFPESPGVYLFRDASSKVLYVGKAKNLKKRVRSYFQSSESGGNYRFSPKMRLLKERLTDFDFYVTDNETEALTLECNLIKEYHPPFNISLRDDKSYPYLAITLSEEFPRVKVTREAHRKGVKYYGPYTKAWAIRETLDTLRRVFPVCTCSESKFRRLRAVHSACLDYHIKKCAGPCIGAISPKEYQELVREIMLFFEGEAEKVIDKLETEMEKAVEDLEFEKAASLRDRLEAAKHVLEKQKVVSQGKENQDCLGFAFEEEFACVQVFWIRRGKLLGSESYLLHQGLGQEEEEILESFVKQYYSLTASIPPLVLIPQEIKDKVLIEKWLRNKRGSRVRLKVPKQGEKRKLIALAGRNAQASLEMFKARRQFKLDRAARELTELKKQLSLSSVPQRIEGFDISTIQGKEAVGSMVVFENGNSKKRDYRRFQIRGVEGQDDFAMMAEVIKRRFHHCLKKEKEPQSKFGLKPDLVLVDGGKPQLSAALKSLKELGIKDISVVALAKSPVKEGKTEEVYLPGGSRPLSFPHFSLGLRLLKRVRDEAHRFALIYHQKLRQKKLKSSVLEEIEGIGEKRRKELLKYFGSLGVLRGASVEELRQVPGISSATARKIYDHLHKSFPPDFPKVIAK